MKSLKTRLALLAAACGLFWLTDPGGAYFLSGQRWAAGTTVVMHLQMQDVPTGTLIDGATSWNTVSESALALWNPFLNDVAFSVVRESTEARAQGNNVNNVFWDDDVYGEPFSEDTLAVTLSSFFTSDNAYAETDVIFNIAFSWDSYRGDARPGSVDLRRVALHEFGHAIGLGHPDENGQSVAAIMNSRNSDLDGLQADDTNGAQAIYGIAAANILRSGARLVAGESLTSLNGRFRLLYQPDGNLVLYDDVDGTTPWNSGTAGGGAGQAILQSDGNFVVYDAQGNPGWFTGTGGNPNARLVLQDDGNIVIYNSSNQPVWDRIGGATPAPAPAPTPTPTPTPTPGGTNVIGQGSAGLPPLTLLSVPFSTSSAGTIGVTTDWTFATNDIDIFLAAGTNPCSVDQFNNQECQFLGSATSATTKPETLSVPNLAGRPLHAVHGELGFD